MNSSKQSKNSIPKDQLLMGIHALKEVLKHAPEKILRVYTERVKDAGRKSEILELCLKEKIPVNYLSFDALTNLCSSDSHQSFVAQIKPRQFFNLKDFFQEMQDSESSLVLMLDQIFDPQNFGALLRSAECFGASAVVFSKNRGSDITAVTTKSSCGASELIPLIRVSNLAEAVSSFQEEGFEAVATVLEPNSLSLEGFRFAKKTLLIMGSEGEGIQPLICKRADKKIYLPMKGNIQSLNVAQACSVFLYAASIQK